MNGVDETIVNGCRDLVAEQTRFSRRLEVPDFGIEDLLLYVPFEGRGKSILILGETTHVAFIRSLPDLAVVGFESRTVARVIDFHFLALRILDGIETHVRVLKQVESLMRDSERL